MPKPRSRTLPRAAVGLLLTLAAVATFHAGAVPTAEAQGWWPWSGGQSPSPPPGPRPPPIPREPVYRDPAARPPAPVPGVPPLPGQKPPICAQLEQRLVAERQSGSTSRDALPKIETEIRQLDRTYHVTQQQLERQECYDYFLFSKTLKRNRQCVELAGQAENTKRRIAELDVQRQQIMGTRGRSFEDDIIRDLARNGCGAHYQEAARQRPSGGWLPWQDEDTGPTGRGPDFRSLGDTYRTVCVRLCDGYFFPVSFSTLQSHFERDADVCQSKCAAPAELYYYQNPGGTIQQAVNARTKVPYMSLKTALRYTKEFVPGCSCKQAEYTPSPADRGDRRAETPPAATTGRQAQR